MNQRHVHNFLCFQINATATQVQVDSNPAYEESMMIEEIKLKANSVYDLTTPTAPDHPHYDYIGMYAAAMPHPPVEEDCDCDIKQSHMYEDVSKICHYSSASDSITSHTHMHTRIT